MYILEFQKRLSPTFSSSSTAQLLHLFIKLGSPKICAGVTFRAHLKTIGGGRVVAPEDGWVVRKSVLSQRILSVVVITTHKKHRNFQSSKRSRLSSKGSITSSMVGLKNNRRNVLNDISLGISSHMSLTRCIKPSPFLPLQLWPPLQKLSTERLLTLQRRSN